MFKAVFASFRLAFALVCIGLSLILGAQWLGFIPDSRVSEDIARRKFCETVAIAAIDDIRHQRWPKLNTTLDALVAQSDTLLSAGLRTQTGTLQIATAQHAQCWPTANETQTVSESKDDLFLDEETPTTTVASQDGIPDWVHPIQPAAESGSIEIEGELIRLDIPIKVQNRVWGNLEFAFRQTSPGYVGQVIDQGILRLLVFFTVIGMGSYTLLMMRILGVFSRTQVVPDRVRQALDTLAEGLLVLDDAGKIVLANENFLTVNGFEPEELIDRLAADLPWVFSPGATKKTHELPWTQAISQRKSVVGEILRLTGRDGVHRVFSINAGPIGDDENQKGALVTFQDVTHVEKHRMELENMLSMLRLSKDEIQKKNQELEILATRDALTGCLNRRAFFERMETMLADYRNAGRPLSCFMVDVDHFKSVNDTYGHHTGDEVLRKVSAVLRDLHEENQIVCRYGGEEFCVMFPGHTLDEAMEQSERTRLAIMNIRLDDPESLRLTASLGVSELRFGAADVQALINQADECLYVAKRGGRNQSVAFDPDRVDVLGEPEESSEDSDVAADVVRLPFHAVTALMSALAYRDPSTAEHSRRVANLCVQAADGLLSQRATYVLEIAAMLHDVGKIGVPDHVLHKPGPLDENEWKIMRRHNTIGMDMIAGTFHCPELEHVIRSHHAVRERSNGERSLKIDDVPLESRLLTIADTYDAIVSDHAYRKGSSHGEAAAELRRHAGKQFDADLVEHFLTKIKPEERENALGISTGTGIAFAIPKPIALKIGQQIERLAEVMDKRDVDNLRELARDLGEIAEASFLMPIVDSTKSIEQAVSKSEDIQWDTLLEETQNLLILCRATQNAHLTEA